MAGTERRPPITPERAEQASIVASSHDAIIGMSQSGVISSCSPAASRLYGYAPSQLVGKSVDVLIPPDLRAAEATIRRRIVAGEEVERYRTDRICEDGTVVTVSLTLSPIVDAAGAIVGIATVSSRAGDQEEARDRFEARVDQQRTEIRVAEDRFQVGMDAERARDRTQTRAAEDRFQVGIDAERAKARSDRDHLESQLQQGQRLEILGQLAGGVAHDFNNLLAVILNYAAFVTDEIAAPGPDLTAVGRDVGQIQRAAERAAALTHQLLAFARREVVQPRVLDLNDLVTDVEQLLRRTLGEDVVLRTELAADLWPVLADAGQVEQVLVNLAVNARDAMSGGGMLTIDTANAMIDAESMPVGLTRPGPYVRLRVSDTGTGMPPDVIEHAFEPFFTTKPDGTGTGLGLATVYGIVSQAGGSVEIRSQTGIGTTFTILIPLTEEVALPAEEPHAYHRTPKGETVLVVEDEDALREVTRRILTGSGYHVITAADSTEAIALAARDDVEIHLLVTDVVMPHMLGKEVAERIRELKPDIRVLYMSGYAQPVLASQGRLDAGVHLIEKPFTARSLIEKTDQILNGHLEGFHTVEAGDPAPSSSNRPPDGTTNG